VRGDTTTLFCIACPTTEALKGFSFLLSGTGELKRMLAFHWLVGKSEGRRGAAAPSFLNQDQTYHVFA